MLWTRSRPVIGLAMPFYQAEGAVIVGISTIHPEDRACEFEADFLRSRRSKTIGEGNLQGRLSSGFGAC